MINPKVPDYGNSIRRLELSEIVHKAKPGENNHCWDDEADEIWSLVTGCVLSPEGLQRQLIFPGVPGGDATLDVSFCSQIQTEYGWLTVW